MNNQPTPNEVAPTPKKKGALFADLLDYIEIIVVSICVVVLIFSFSGFRICTVSGPSMENTLLHGEKLITSDLFYTPKRGDIVVFHQTSDAEWGYNEPIVKRVIALPGDTVELDRTNWTIKVTDKDGNVMIFEEPYRKDQQFAFPTTPIYVEDGTVFVMGDNRNNSADSRGQAIGPVDTRRILGKVVLRITPLDRFGPVA